MHLRNPLARGLLLALTTAGAGAAPPSPEQLAASQRYSESAGGQAMLVMHEGKIVFEAYANGGGKDRAQTLASGTKSFVGVAAMAAVEDGLIRLDDKACESLTEWQDDPIKSQITCRQLLTLTSGLTAGERGSAIRSPGWKAIIAKPMAGKPGEQFEYGAYHLCAFAEGLQRRLQNETFEQYLARRILQPLGIKLDWRVRCEDGNPQVGGGGAMTARDWATFGEFMRLGDRWEGQQLVRADLLAECLKGTEKNPAYGLTWWLREPVPEAILRQVPILQRDMGDIVTSDWLPEDLFLAAGAGKQRLYVLPSLKLVIVRQGDLMKSRAFSDATFLKHLFRGSSADRQDSRESPKAEASPGTESGTDLPWVTPAIHAPRLQHRTFDSTAAGTHVSYHLYTPPAYDAEPERRFPVLYWLHGSGGGLPGIAPLVKRFDGAIRDGQMPPTLVVFVNGLPHGMYCDWPNGQAPVETVLIRELVPHLDATFRTVPTREGRLLEGFSMGGYGAARLGFKYPELFGAVSILAGGPLQPDFTEAPRAGPANRDQILQTVFGGDLACFRAQSPWHIAETNAAALRTGPRLRQIIGDRDETLRINRDFHTHLERLGIPHDYREVPGIGHQPNALLDALGDQNWSFYHPAPVQAYDPLTLTAPAQGAPLDFTVTDSERNRDLPVRIYLPDETHAAPVVLFSHGLGGSREGSAFLGRHWAARGYLAVFLQHPGSDDSVWRNQAPAQINRAMGTAASSENFLHRVRDVPAVLDQLTRWNEETNHALRSRLDLSRVGMSGHSFGAITTQAVSGQAVPGGGQPYTDPRIRAAIAFSPSVPQRGTAEVAFGKVNLPWLLMTGTKDVARLGGATLGAATVEQRLAVFPALPAGSKYELVLHEAEHSAFTDRALPGESGRRNPNHHRAILALSTAFWDASLREDAAARAWLEGEGPRSVLEAQDRWQKK